MKIQHSNMAAAIANETYISTCGHWLQVGMAMTFGDELLTGKQEQKN